MLESVTHCSLYPIAPTEAQLRKPSVPAIWPSTGLVAGQNVDSLRRLPVSPAHLPFPSHSSTGRGVLCRHPEAATRSASYSYGRPRGRLLSNIILTMTTWKPWQTDLYAQRENITATIFQLHFKIIIISPCDFQIKKTGLFALHSRCRLVCPGLQSHYTMWWT